MDNVQFLRTRIDFIENFFEEREIDEIWLTFQIQPKNQEKDLPLLLLVAIENS